MLLVMGVIFLAIPLAMFVIPMDPASVNVTVNGVRQPPSEASLRNFRLIFLAAMGIPGLALLIVGGVVFRGNGKRKRLRETLALEGKQVWADVMGVERSFVNVNNRPLLYLRCSYRDDYGQTYLFKSAKLSMDPTGFLPDGKVLVYYDPRDPSRYIVDVDGTLARHNINIM